MAQTNKEHIASYKELLSREDAVAKGLAKIDFIAGQILDGTFNPGRGGQFSKDYLRTLPFDKRVDAGMRLGQINQRLQESAKPTLQSSETELAELKDRVQGIIELVANGHLPQSFLDDIFAESEVHPVIVIEAPAFPQDQINTADAKKTANEASVHAQKENNRKRIIALDRVLTTVQNPQSKDAITRDELATIGLATARMNTLTRSIQSPEERWNWMKKQISYPSTGIINALNQRIQSGNVIAPEDMQFVSHVQEIMKQRGIPTQNTQKVIEYFQKNILQEWIVMQEQKEDSIDSSDESEVPTEEASGLRRERSVLIGKYEQYGNQRADVLLRILRQEPVGQEELVSIIYATSLQPLRYKENEDQPALRWEVVRALIEANHREAVLPAMAKRYSEGKAPASQKVFMDELLSYVHQLTGLQHTPMEAAHYFRKEIFAKWADTISKGQEVEAVDELLVEMKRVTESYERIYGERLLVE